MRSHVNEVVGNFLSTFLVLWMTRTGIYFAYSTFLVLRSTVGFGGTYVYTHGTMSLI